jgi:hypothetical protein
MTESSRCRSLYASALQAIAEQFPRPRVDAAQAMPIQRMDDADTNVGRLLLHEGFAASRDAASRLGWISAARMDSETSIKNDRALSTAA